MVLQALRNAGPELTTDSLIKGIEAIHEYKDIFGTTYSFGPGQHHGETSSFLSIVKDGRWQPVQTEAIAY